MTTIGDQISEVARLKAQVTELAGALDSAALAFESAAEYTGDDQNRLMLLANARVARAALAKLV